MCTPATQAVPLPALPKIRHKRHICFIRHGRPDDPTTEAPLCAKRAVLRIS